MDFKTKYMIGLEERISLTEKLTNLQAQLKQQKVINYDLLKHINTLQKFKCPHCSQKSSANRMKETYSDTVNNQNQERYCQELDSRQALEQMPFLVAESKSTPIPQQRLEPVPPVSGSQPTFSGKKPFNYQQLNMLNNLHTSSESESNTPSEKSDGEKIDLNDDTLVPWTDIVKQNHPKLLNGSNQRSYEKYILEFLDDRLDKIAYNRCYIYRDGRYTWGIPDDLADDFEDFFEKMVVDGTVQRLENMKKKTTVCTPSVKINQSKNSSVKKSTGKSRRSSSLVELDSSEDNLLRSIKAQKSNEFIPWIDLVKDRLPHIAIDLTRMAEIAKNFLVSEKLAEKMTKCATGVSCLGIPAGFSDDFIGKISSQFSPQKEKASSEASGLINNPLIGSKKIAGEYFFCWRDLALEKFQHIALQDPRTRIFDCVMAGVQDFWEKNVSEAQKKESRRIKSCRGPRASFGIPESSLIEFYEWYKRNLRRGFKDYDINGSSESLKHSLDSESSPESRAKKFKTVDVSSDDSVAAMGPLSAPFPVEPSPFAMYPLNEEYFSSNILTDMDMVFPGSEGHRPGPENAFSFTEPPRPDILFPCSKPVKSGLTLYTDLLRSLMPSFCALPISDRQNIKKQVELYISQKLGSSARLAENIVSVESESGRVISTFGIQSEWHTEFTQWGILLLRGIYGIENVPLQSWEHFSV